MFNPKTTPSPRTAKAVTDIKGGADSTSCRQAGQPALHRQGLLDEKKLAENHGAALDEVLRAGHPRRRGPLPEEGHRLDDHRPRYPGGPSRTRNFTEEA